MYAIVDIAGQQFKVQKDQKIYVNRLVGEEGAQVSFDQVFMDVKLVGSQTDGKPVGMYVFFDKYFNYAFFPICFSTQNSLGVGDYYSGITVDMAAADDLGRDFGDPLEDSMSKALQALGVSAPRSYSIVAPSVHRIVPAGGFGEILGSY